MTPGRHCNPILGFHHNFWLKIACAQAGCLWPFFLKVLQLLVAAIWMCSQIGSSCRMSEYSTGPTAVRKEQGVVNVLWFQTHPGLLFLPGLWKMGNGIFAFSLFLSSFLGALPPAMEGVNKANARDVISSFLYLPIISLNISLNLCSKIF